MPVPRICGRLNEGLCYCPGRRLKYSYVYRDLFINPFTIILGMFTGASFESEIASNIIMARLCSFLDKCGHQIIFHCQIVFKDKTVLYHPDNLTNCFPAQKCPTGELNCKYMYNNFV